MALHSRNRSARRKRSPDSWWHWFAVAIFTGTGCSGGATLYPVEGKVFFDGDPLTTGDIVFYSDEGKPLPSDQIPLGTIDAKGGYRISTGGKPGAPPGKYRVVVIAQSQTRPANVPANPMNLYPLIPSIYFNEATTRLRLEIVASPPPEHYDLKIAR